MDIMNVNKISMPPGLSMLGRGMERIERVVAEISPKTNIVQIASSRIASAFLQNLDLKEELKKKDVFCTALFTRLLKFQLSWLICFEATEIMRQG